MKTIFRLLVILLVSHGAKASDLEGVASCLQTEYSQLKKWNSIAAAVLDEKDQKILYFGQGSPQQLFEIGSITKTFTALLLAQDVSAGRLKIDDPIPLEYQKPGSVISYRHLTTHTSGIIEGIFPSFAVTNELYPFEGLTVPEFKKHYALTPLKSTPGEIAEYSNIGVALLGLVLSENSSEDYVTLVQNRILNPLGMSESYFQIPSEKMSLFGQGRLLDVQGNAQMIPPWDLYKTAINPTGGLRSNIGDMVKYARANLAPSTSPQLQQAIKLSHEPLSKFNEQGAWIGYNWIIFPESNWIFHNGRTYGFNSALLISKRKGQAIVALTDTNVINVVDGEETFDDSLENIAFKCMK